MNSYKKLLFFLIPALVVISCDVEDGENLNGADTASVSSDISRGELGDAIGGILADMRRNIATQVDASAVVGREYWRIQSSDPRWTGDLLTGLLDNNTFYTTQPFGARYATVKDVNLVLEGLENTTADFSDAEKSAIRGFVNTIKAHELLSVLHLQFQNGIRVDVADPNNLGPFVSYTEALDFLTTLLASATSDLAAGGTSFPFALTSGFEAFNSPANFLGFAKAVAARVELYKGNYPGVLSQLADSFLDLGGDLNSGAYLTFSLTGVDVANPLFFALNSTVANARIVHPSFVADAEAGDNRLAKAQLRDTPLTNDNLTGAYDVWVYQSNVAPIGIIRNEELILMYAEAHHITNPTEAVNAINVIRNAAGLANYAGGTAAADLANEILNQRRYSLFAEGGHRWIDLRRFDRLADLPLDRTGDGRVTQFPIPQNENQ
ncbi:RagB/SusD family nutrient uptake outer membrane protein [Arenibacter sp. GZD96]|uniref:RagB/SusD family nutrient uptake outer membrane protein n=1 Tax=Aurantibrevibacter litoralis TaxID=3106030 RepID=UPI002AFFDA45|nr:RagB/SusD family nutrient uptake outer membrane protein [Arenibacter sp. GZD-96]MEA1786644.1 RagB/SusD family nutrient uptake outer membrane protein [Arenibacter sp. GZD-96]